MLTSSILINRVWAMPSADTFDVPPIAEFVRRYLADSTVSADPFARNKRWATYTNDIDTSTGASYHDDAEVFLNRLQADGVSVDLLIFDPPYSPRQISECYQRAGLPCSMTDTQNSRLYKRVRDAAMPILAPDAVVLSFGWNSSGMGKDRGFEIEEILICCHGSAHNDSICMAERRVQGGLF